MATEEDTAILQARSITKRFGSVVANDSVDFDLRKGEIHALLGENGAGKTTFCNILYGMLKPEKGKIILDGREVGFNSPREAIKAGIGMVHQEFMLIPTMTVAENIALLMDNGRQFLVDMNPIHAAIRRLASEYGLSVNPKSKVSQLSVGERQRVEILKALFKGANILILDEPTSVLTRLETQELFSSLRNMAMAGKSIIFVTHKIDEVLGNADRVTVLRQGRVVATLGVGDVDRQNLARLIVGRDVLFSIQRPETSVGSLLLDMRDVVAYGDMGVKALKNVSLKVSEGEIVGIAGVAGNGQREMVEVVTGLRRVSSGKVFMFNRDVTHWPPDRIRRLGVAYIPEEQRIGLIYDFGLHENLVVSPHLAERLKRGWLLDGKALKLKMSELMEKFDIKAQGPDAATWTLSGGNKQKAILARELWADPKLIVANNPTKGLDIAATEYVRGVLLQAKAQQKGVLLISSELDEVLEMSDRIVVMHDGRIVGEFRPGQVKIDELASLMLSGRAA